MGQLPSRIQGQLAIAEGNACLAVQRYAEADVELRKGLELGAGGYWDHLSVLRARLAQREYASAREALKGWDAAPSGLLAVIDLLEGTGDAATQAAVASMNEAVRVHPYYHFWAGLTAFVADQHRQSEEHLRTFLGLQPPYPQWAWSKMRWEKDEAHKRLGALRSLLLHCHFCSNADGLELVDWRRNVL